MAENTQTAGSFDVGGEPPDSTIVRVSGVMFADRELHKGEEVHMQIIDTNGVVITNGYGNVATVTFTDRRDKETGEITATQRVHVIKVT